MAQKSSTLLVVDDEELNRDMLSRRLQRAGYDVMVAPDGYSALGMVESEPIGLVILDIMMPGITGMQVLEKLRKTRSETVLPIIMASALSESKVIVEALSKGANDYITKPIDMPVLLARIETQLRHKQEPGEPEELEVSEPTDPLTIGPGTVLGGRYRLVEALGQGGFGNVYRARHLELEFDVAVKTLHMGMANDEAMLERFRREGISACRVRHPNAVNIYDFQTTPHGLAYLVMEYLRGMTLRDYLEDAGALPLRRCAEIVTPVCAALAAAHHVGVVHRDIKPANLFLESTPTGEMVRVLDFGIAGLLDDAGRKTLTQQGMVMGSPRYMAPEQLTGQPADGKADVFSLGLVVHQMLNGRPPFPRGRIGDRLRSPTTVPPLDDSVPPAVRDVVMSALSARPKDRPTAQDFGRLFQVAVEGRLPAGGMDETLTAPRALADDADSTVTAAVNPSSPDPREG